jgi:hypothetical protein
MVSKKGEVIGGFAFEKRNLIALSIKSYKLVIHCDLISAKILSINTF